MDEMEKAQRDIARAEKRFKSACNMIPHNFNPSLQKWLDDRYEQHLVELTGYDPDSGYASTDRNDDMQDNLQNVLYGYGNE